MRVVSAFKDLAFIGPTIIFIYRHNPTQIQLLICLKRMHVKILRTQRRKKINSGVCCCVTVPVIELAEVDKFAAGKVL